MTDTLAASQIHHFKAEVAKPVVRFKQDIVGILAVELERVGCGDKARCDLLLVLTMGQ